MTRADDFISDWQAGPAESAEEASGLDGMLRHDDRDRLDHRRAIAGRSASSREGRISDDGSDPAALEIARPILPAPFVDHEADVDRMRVKQVDPDIPEGPVGERFRKQFGKRFICGAHPQVDLDQRPGRFFERHQLEFRAARLAVIDRKASVDFLRAAGEDEIPRLAGRVGMVEAVRFKPSAQLADAGVRAAFEPWQVESQVIDSGEPDFRLPESRSDLRDFQQAIGSRMNFLPAGGVADFYGFRAFAEKEEIGEQAGAG